MTFWFVLWEPRMWSSEVGGVGEAGFWFGVLVSLEVWNGTGCSDEWAGVDPLLLR